MKVLQIDKIQIDDTYIYYRRNYTAEANIELVQKNFLANIFFTIETDPFGQNKISLEEVHFGHG